MEAGGVSKLISRFEQISTPATTVAKKSGPISRTPPKNDTTVKSDAVGKSNIKGPETPKNGIQAHSAKPLPQKGAKLNEVLGGNKTSLQAFRQMVKEDAAAEAKAAAKPDLAKEVKQLKDSAATAQINPKKEAEFSQQVKQTASQLAEKFFHAGTPEERNQAATLLSDLSGSLKDFPKLKKEVNLELKVVRSLVSHSDKAALKPTLGETLSHLCASHGISKEDTIKEARLMGGDEKTAQLKMTQRLLTYHKGLSDAHGQTPSLAKRMEQTGYELSVVKGVDKAFREFVTGKSTEVSKPVGQFTAIMSSGKVFVEEKFLGAGTFKAATLASDFFAVQHPSQRGQLVTLKPKPKVPMKPAVEPQQAPAAPPAATAAAAKPTKVEESNVEEFSSVIVKEEPGEEEYSSVIVKEEPSEEEYSSVIVKEEPGEEEYSSVIVKEEPGEEEYSSVIVKEEPGEEEYSSVIVKEEPGEEEYSSVIVKEEPSEEEYSSVIVKEEPGEEEYSSVVIKDEPKQTASAAKPAAKEEVGEEEYSSVIFSGDAEDSSVVIKDSPKAPAKADTPSSSPAVSRKAAEPPKMSMAEVFARVKNLEQGGPQKISPENPDLKLSEMKTLVAELSTQPDKKEVVASLNSRIAIREKDNQLRNEFKAVTRTERDEYNYEIDITQKLQGPGIIKMHSVIDLATGDKMMIQEAAGLKLPAVEGLRQSTTAIDLKQMRKALVNGQLSASEQKMMLDIYKEGFQGVVRMHDLGYIHRDLKEENILITPDGHGVLADFGSVVRTKDDPHKSVYIGTPTFGAPETSKHAGKETWNEVGEKADVWSCGMIVFNSFVDSLKNHPAVKGKSAEQLFQIQKTAHMRAEGYQEDYPEPADKMSLEHLAWSATRLNPDERPTMKEFTARFEEISTSLKKALG